MLKIWSIPPPLVTSDPDTLVSKIPEYLDTKVFRYLSDFFSKYSVSEDTKYLDTLVSYKGSLSGVTPRSC